jgi:hypothetical protein
MSANAMRDASYITKKNQAVAVNAGYTQYTSALNAGAKYVAPQQPKGGYSSQILLQRNLGCAECARRNNLIAKQDNQPYDANLLPIPNATPCGSCGRSY